MYLKCDKAIRFYINSHLDNEAKSSRDPAKLIACIKTMATRELIPGDLQRNLATAKVKFFSLRQRKNEPPELFAKRFIYAYNHVRDLAIKLEQSQAAQAAQAYPVPPNSRRIASEATPTEYPITAHEVAPENGISNANPRIFSLDPTKDPLVPGAVKSNTMSQAELGLLFVEMLHPQANASFLKDYRRGFISFPASGLTVNSIMFIVSVYSMSR